MIRVLSRDFVMCRMGVSFRSGLKMATTGWVRIPLLPVWPFLEVLSGWLAFSDEPTSNKDGENAPWWLPSVLLSQPIRIGLIRASKSLREGERCSGTTTTNKSGSGQESHHPVITGRPVPLSGLPRPATERPHRRSDGVWVWLWFNEPTPPLTRAP